MDTKKVRDAIVEISNSMVRSDAEKELVREIIKKIHDDEGLDRRVLRKVARSYHKGNFQEESAINDEFETAFTNIMG